jgi:alginate O-acetyltransferase complex protein AlgI
MLFNSIEFAVFLPTVFVAYWFVFARSLRWRNLFLWAVSYLFYGWWDWRFLLLIALSSGVDYWVALIIAREENEVRRRRILTFSLLGNLGLLGLFKYFDFFVESLEQALGAAGVDTPRLRLGLVLPVGISFYTFQSLSYTIDVYRRQLEPCRDPVKFFAFVSFFPQLVAGPIERAGNLLAQFDRVAPFDEAAARDGGRQILWGLFKKMLIADNASRIVDGIFTNYGERSGAELAAGAVFFSFQIYGDFSGYSDIALGTAKLFGFRLNPNFSYPYFSRDIAEFWRRWHISLTTWFKDYVYIPLGGSRGSRYRNVRNVMIVFLLSGLWHGASWTYVVWGALNGILFLPLLLGSRNRRHLDHAGAGRRLPAPGEALRMLATFFAVTLTWVFFRAPSLEVALGYLAGLADATRWRVAPAPAAVNNWLMVGSLIGIMLAVEWRDRRREHGLDLTDEPRWLRWSVYPALIVSFFLFAVFDSDGFIYFQF